MPKPPKYNKSITQNRRDIIAKSEKSLLEIAASAGQKVYKEVVKQVIGLLSIQNGKIVKSAENFNAANKATFVNTVFAKEFKPQIINLFDDATGKINKEAFAYFNSYAPELKLDKIRKNAEELQKQRLGIGKPNGYLESLTNTQQIEILVNKTVLNAIASEQDFETFRATLQNQLTGTQVGSIINQIQLNAFDAFAQYDRTLYNQYGTELGLNYAVYQGGEIKTTRVFCEERNGNVYNRETIESWDLLEWAGKKPNNDIFIDCGGYNCRHYLDWISYELAVQINPEIEKSKYDN